jgi:hypothetical protein
MIKHEPKIITILFSLFILVACASDSYNYYGLDVSRIDRVELSNGKLLAKKEQDDLVLSECLPKQSQKSPCIVLFKSEYFKILRDLEEYKARLKACEKN